MFHSRRWILILSLVSVVAVGGCGPKRPKTTPVSGTVTYKSQPVKGAAVLFVPKVKGPVARGLTDDSGQYRLRTFEPDDGAVPGDYAVSVNVPLPKSTKPGVAVKPLLPPKYVSSETSGLKITVETGKTEYPLNLE